MSKKKTQAAAVKPDAVVVGGQPQAGLQVLQQMVIGMQDIVQVGVAQHEKHLIATGNDIARRLTDANAKLEQLKVSVRASLSTHAELTYGHRMRSLERSMIDIGFSISKCEVVVADDVTELIRGDGEGQKTSCTVRLQISEKGDRSYSTTQFSAEAEMPLSREELNQLAKCSVQLEYIRRLTAASNQVKKARQDIPTYERQLSASLSEANLRGSEKGRETLRVISAMPKFELGISIEAPVTEG